MIQAAVVLGVLAVGLVRATSEECRETLDPNSIPRQIVYTGSIREDARLGEPVSFRIPILARNKSNLVDGEVCGYTMYKDSTFLPFKIQLLDRHSGCARVVVDKEESVPFRDRRSFTFELAARDCFSGNHAPRELVQITVTDVREEAPRVSQDSYLVEVEEGHMYQEILRLDVVDNDGSRDFSSICNFHILTRDVPFIIEGQGILRNTEPLDFSRNHNYILTVRVEDCGRGTSSRMSDRVIINIKVREACRPGWKGITERADYPPTGAKKLIGENAVLETCDSSCHQRQVSARVHLATEHIGKGCDRDTYSIQSQRKLCGASSGSVDLLPNPAVSSWTRALPTDDGNESDQIFAFDGRTNAIEIPSTKFNHTLGAHFTISTWMKHEQDPNDDSKHGAKEHIMCNSDGEKMNRHHYSLFVHNCRLVFLLRQEPSGADLNVFKPAEWRWKMPQVCDGQWHHYAVSVDFPQVRLYLDGKLLVESRNNPEIIDDWPLHPTRKIHFSKLVVGACWQGGSQALSQYFTGYLAGLSILKDKTESDRVIKCLNNCKEKLDFHAMNEMETGMQVSLNSEMTDITITGHNSSEVEKLIRKVGYINTRMFPTPGHRNLDINTTVTCDDGREITIPSARSTIVVLQAEQPIITLSGSPSLARSEHDFVHGQRIFGDLVISSTTRAVLEEEDESDLEEEEGMESIERYKLDSCVIRAEPSMDLDVEHFKLPANLMQQLGLEASLSEDGIVITGIDQIGNYRTVLQQIQYVNRQPADLNSRTFTLTCSELNGRFVSNELRTKVDVVHTYHQAVPMQPAHAQADVIDIKAKRVQPMQNINDLHLEEKNNYFESGGRKSEAGVGMTIIIVVCVGFLIFMIVLGVIRIRAAHQRTQVVTVDEKPEMEWDNSALTITVNPMEQGDTAAYENEHELNALRDDSDSDDDDISSYHDELESSEEESEKVKDRDLEWDDSTLTF